MVGFTDTEEYLNDKAKRIEIIKQLRDRLTNDVQFALTFSIEERIELNFALDYQILNLEKEQKNGN